jgi:hypothetical protein
MKSLKRVILIILILIIVGILFRGSVYRSLVFYKSIGQRKNYSVTDNKLANCINTSVETLKAPQIEQIIEVSLSITSKQLNFTADKNHINPNQLIKSKTAHCVGYSTFFATTCNYLLKKYKLSENWIAKPQIGQIYLFGINIHNFFDSPFFKDHDFVTIENKTTGEIVAVDPTVNDYLRIDNVFYIK